MLTAAYRGKREGCPCCEERVVKRGGVRYVLRDQAPPEACEDCVLPPPLPRSALSSEVPPFVWPRTIKDVEDATEEVKAATKTVLDQLSALKEEDLTFDNLIKPLMQAPYYKTNPLVAQSKHLQHCSPDPVIREASSKASTVFAGLKKEGKTRKDIYKLVKAYSEKPEAKSLPEYEAHFLTSILAVFERSGLALSEAEAAKLSQMLDQDVEVCTKFKKNIGEDTTKVIFKPTDLQGCDESFVKERTNEAGDVVISLKMPDILPILEECEVSDTRKRLTMERDSAYGNNLDLVAEGVSLRKQIAGLLGYKSWAHYVTERRMAGSPEKIFEFLGGIEDKAKAGAASDKERLRQLKIEHLQERSELPAGGPEEVKLEAWDVMFYNSRLLKRSYGVDHEAIRKYFPCTVVVDGTLEIYQDLLGLKFTEIKEFDTWHPQVRLFVVHDSATGEKIGYFYLDLHPREGKYNHAAIFHLLKRRVCEDGSVQTPVDCMLTNLPAPSPDGTPALLRHGDVVTFFHEFGHIMHGLCSEGNCNSTTLAKCPRDFVEAPSQMLENWCFNRGVLQRLSKHIETGESLPEAQINKLLDAKNVNEGLMMLRQLYLGILDLTIHGESPPTDAKGLQDLVDNLRPRISLIENPPGCNMLRSFGHLMNQYSAGYYGYLWAEVLSADMFESCFEKDPFSKEAGMAYRKMVLGPGGTGNIAVHLEKFLGHAPTQEPFLRSRGILK
mmetsp:Transcript_32285/g.69109  ORF Transcript_32285/g.69109 Transcript_32285/m.69109 type:complete len:724 (+) Transcript_32285:237-2408(+)|eukprot:CAMPEP_0206451442 /NCGR_PEP_ID=MMETSP0324_2-20121206/19341_1 /ASSEMBLY_ACC=CAM_ASM_000836 /TAXON_ID=2866 /ORGANISM="Crypthecodinium cohnii, Strain Seligo" /LENGTH=723 /DNA_ID=CAMNT_0053921319 /DNA_START=220 /DNA_END=2391 /DNA_ORIENTATION=-